MACLRLSPLFQVFLATLIAGVQTGCGGGGTEPVDPVVPESKEPVAAAPVVGVPERLYTEFQTDAGVSQCAVKSSVPATDRLKALVTRLQSQGIEVVSSSCGSTGLLYAAVCGGGNGDLFLVTVKPVQGSVMRALGFGPTTLSPPPPVVLDCKLVS